MIFHKEKNGKDLEDQAAIERKGLKKNPPAELWGVSKAYFIIAKNTAPAQSAVNLLYDNLPYKERYTAINECTLKSECI